MFQLCQKNSLDVILSEQFTVKVLRQRKLDSPEGSGKYKFHNSNIGGLCCFAKGQTECCAIDITLIFCFSIFIGFIRKNEGKKGSSI